MTYVLFDLSLVNLELLNISMNLEVPYLKNFSTHHYCNTIEEYNAYINKCCHTFNKYKKFQDNAPLLLKQIAPLLSTNTN